MHTTLYCTHYISEKACRGCHSRQQKMMAFNALTVHFTLLLHACVQLNLDSPFLQCIAVLYAANPRQMAQFVPIISNSTSKQANMYTLSNSYFIELSLILHPCVCATPTTLNRSKHFYRVENCSSKGLHLYLSSADNIVTNHRG